MKRTPIVRKAPLRAKGPARETRPDRSEEFASYTPAPRSATMRRADGCARLTVPVPKVKPERDEAYRRLVASLPCDYCGLDGYSQCAHPNTGKGVGTKADDKRSFPLCADRPGQAGCHSRFDQGALMAKAERRAYEEAAMQRTHSKLRDLCVWPDKLEALG